jgi:DNA-binding transcriptional LysR family regulator
MQFHAHHPLQIWCMPGFALLWLNSRLANFEQIYSDVNVEVRPTNMSPNLDVSDADVDIRFIASYEKGFHLAPNVRSLELAAPALIAVASPEYLDHNKTITSPNDLLDHHLLHEEDFTDWREWLSANGTIVKDKLTGPLLWQGHLTLDAAKYGRGVALSNSLIIKDELENGQLIHVGADNPSFANNITGSYLFMAREDRWNWLPIRNFRTWLKKETTRAMTRIGTLITK